MSARMIEPSIEPTTAYIGLGANLGDVRATLQQAIAALHAPPGRQVLRVSPFYRTAPVEAAGPHYLNAVVELSTSLDADALLAHLQEIENKHGRERPYRNAPRTLDLDLLLFGDVVIDTPMLSVPHPRLHTRAFVLRPLADLTPGLLVPGQGQVEQLLAAVADQRIDADKLSP